MKKNASKILLNNALCWGVSFVIPPIVMVVLDSFDWENPTRVALFSSMALMVWFGITNAILTKGLVKLTSDEQ